MVYVDYNLLLQMIELMLFQFLLDKVINDLLLHIVFLKYY